MKTTTSKLQLMWEMRGCEEIINEQLMRKKFKQCITLRIINNTRKRNICNGKLTLSMKFEII